MTRDDASLWFARHDARTRMSVERGRRVITRHASCLKPADRFGPWADGLSHAERIARLRCLRAIVHMTCGSRGEAFSTCLQQAESDPAALVASVDELARLEPLDRRRVLATYAALHRTRPEIRR